VVDYFSNHACVSNHYRRSDHTRFIGMTAIWPQFTLQSKVLSNVYGLSNLVMFLFMITFLLAILACQLVRGDIPSTANGTQYEISFRTIWNSFLGMYQILSSENWTVILYAATNFQTEYHIAWISTIFFTAWFMIGNSKLTFCWRY
jgi:voltage-dependent calcium channel